LVCILQPFPLKPRLHHSVLEKHQIYATINNSSTTLSNPTTKSQQKNSPFHLEGGVDWSTDSRSSFLVHTKMGPSKSSGTGSPRRTRRSSPVPMSCKALPTLPPPTMTAGTTLAGGAVAVVAAADMAEGLNMGVVMVVGEMGKESEVAMKEWLFSGGGWSEEHRHGSFCSVCLWNYVVLCLSIFIHRFSGTIYATRSLERFYLCILHNFFHSYTTCRFYGSWSVLIRNFV